jgi:hypothetical protein
MRARPMRAKAAVGRAAPLTSGCASGGGSMQPSARHRARVPGVPENLPGRSPATGAITS